MDIFSLLLPKYTIDKNKKVRLITLFSGYDSQKLGFNYLDIDVEHYRAIEFDKYAIQSLNEIHNTQFETKDITKVSVDELGIVDTENITYIMTYSFPCTDLSLAGKRAGMDRDSGTRSGLLWEVERLLKETKEKPQILIMENVPQVLSAKGWREWNVFLENLGYSNYAQILNAKNFGIPQNRERCFMVSILGEYSYEFPKPFELKDRLKDFLEENVDEKYYLSEKTLQRISKWKAQQDPLKDIDKEKVVSPTLTARGAGEEHSGMILINENLYNNQNMKTTLCNSLIENGVVKENYVINHSYTNGLNGKNPNSRQTLEDYIETTDNSSHCLTTRPDTLGVVVKEYVGTIDYAQSETLRPTMESRIKIDNDVSGTLLQTGNQNGIIENHKPKLVGGFGEMKSNGGTQWYQQDRVYDSENVAMCHCANIPSGSYNYQLSDLRIRKLTPCECFKLMGVKPSDYNNITCSNAQKYKQAGNSIVTTVLMAIFSQLFENCDYKYYIEELLKELRSN